METTKIRKFGGSVGVIIPKHIADASFLTPDTNVYMYRDAEGIRIIPYDPDFQEALEAARGFMASHRNAFKKLAE